MQCACCIQQVGQSWFRRRLERRRCKWRATPTACRWSGGNLVIVLCCCWFINTLSTVSSTCSRNWSAAPMCIWSCRRRNENETGSDDDDIGTNAAALLVVESHNKQILILDALILIVTIQKEKKECFHGVLLLHEHSLYLTVSKLWLLHTTRRLTPFEIFCVLMMIDGDLRHFQSRTILACCGWRTDGSNESESGRFRKTNLGLKLVTRRRSLLVLRFWWCATTFHFTSYLALLPTIFF